MLKILAYCLLLLLVFPLMSRAESSEGIPLLTAPIDPQDMLSLQRGAKIYINYCSGCHSLAFMRYNRLAKDIGIVDNQGKVDTQLVKDNLIFTGAGIADTIQVAMSKKDGQSWFGVAPPDLSLEARARGVDWIYTYLLSFYQDDSRPLGANNLLYNETAMPDILVNLQGIQKPIYQDRTIIMNGVTQQVHEIKQLVILKPGSMTPHQFNMAMADLVNFLNYVSEPARSERQNLGKWVLGYLLILIVLTYLLKKEYWKKIKK